MLNKLIYMYMPINNFDVIYSIQKLDLRKDNNKYNYVCIYKLYNKS